MIGTEWHFPVMVAASLVLFVGMLRLVLSGVRFRRRLLAVAIVLFSFFLGWDEYMPFLPVPTLESLIAQ